MLLTIGMPSYDNFEEVWFTVQALRLYQDLDDTEILVLDNQGSDKLQSIIKGFQQVRYERYAEINGTGPARNAIFDHAKGDFVLIMDSHVFLWADAIKKIKEWLKSNWDNARNLIQGPMVYSSLLRCNTHYLNQWRAGMWGIWPPVQHVCDLKNDNPIEIEMGPLGLFGCRKDSWLRFHKDCKGFDGVEGVIHEKYRKQGRKVLCLPFLKWIHFYNRHEYSTEEMKKRNNNRFFKKRIGQFNFTTEDKIRNFLLGFEEIGLDKMPIYEHFGINIVESVAKKL